VALLLAVCTHVEALNVVVISPAGGIGEAAAVSVAKRGNDVKWFVLQSDETSNEGIALSSEVFSSIEVAGGSVELAGSSVKSMLDEDGGTDVVAAVGKWCSMMAQPADALICTADDISDDSGDGVRTDALRAVCLAAKQASTSFPARTKKIAVVRTKDSEADDNEDENNGILSGLFGKEADSSIASIPGALGEDSVVLQYGELFGVPGAPAFVGGPRRDPILREEFVMQAVRLEPFRNDMETGKSLRTSRLALGEAAAMLTTTPEISENVFDQGVDICVTSLRGEVLTEGDWKNEFSRAVNSAKNMGNNEILFEANFSSVPSIRRLSDWLATKWFPAILKTSFELATIQTGARPVYATVPSDERVEIVWQQLIDFKSVNVGKLIIDVSQSGIIARREIFSKSNDIKKLPSEGVLVRRLADASAQAIEKGLASKPQTFVVEEPIVEVQAKVNVQARTTAVSAGNLDDDESGPRAAGTRRSSERSRGRSVKAKVQEDREKKEIDQNKSWQ